MHIWQAWIESISDFTLAGMYCDLSLVPLMLEHPQCPSSEKILNPGLPNIKIHIHVLVFLQKIYDATQRRLPNSPRHTAALMHYNIHVPKPISDYPVRYRLFRASPMHCDFLSGFDNGVYHIIPRQAVAVVRKANGFVGVGDVVEERIGRKTATKISIFTLSPLRPLGFASVFAVKSSWQLTSEKTGV